MRSGPQDVAAELRLGHQAPRRDRGRQHGGVTAGTDFTFLGQGNPHLGTTNESAFSPEDAIRDGFVS